jgi:hypothetical protein
METIHRYYDLRRHIKEIAPELLVADGDLHALRLAHRWGIPAVYVTNVIRPSYGFSSLLNPGERFTERYVRKCAKIVIPDNPPPYTISQYNLGNLRHVGINDKTEFVGSFFNTTPTAGSENHVFAPVSGPFGTRAKLLQMLIPVFEELGVKTLISLGILGERKIRKIGSCEVHSWLTVHEREEFMRNANLVVFSGGHITCFETIGYAKPSICIPTQPEQLANAAKLQAMHCSITARNKAQLRLAVREVEEEYASFKASVEALNRFSNRFNGLNRAVEIIENTKIGAGNPRFTLR